MHRRRGCSVSLCAHGHARPRARRSRCHAAATSRSTHHSRAGLLWAWHGMAWHGMARHGMPRHGTARHGTARHGMAWHGMPQVRRSRGTVGALGARLGEPQRSWRGAAAAGSVWFRRAVSTHVCGVDGGEMALGLVRDDWVLPSLPIHSPSGYCVSTYRPASLPMHSQSPDEPWHAHSTHATKRTHSTARTKADNSNSKHTIACAHAQDSPRDTRARISIRANSSLGLQGCAVLDEPFRPPATANACARGILG